MPTSILRRLVLSACATWLGVRVLVACLGYVDFSYLGVMATAGVTLAATWLDLRRNNEIMFSANLGVGPKPLASIVLLVAVVLELVVGVPIASLLPESTDAALF